MPASLAIVRNDSGASQPQYLDGISPDPRCRSGHEYNPPDNRAKSPHRAHGSSASDANCGKQSDIATLGANASALALAHDTILCPAAIST
ncbi:hypothetical protein GCM10027169_32680 [Gordonia jinhuaensis]|uniref:Uncharacterized protein n=1 Tax=Gordonia jinhuaensis TaxID=1517702 RepID=A0A916T657_9ACTN|nr:hypothetical protein GCM10011489_21820 [Gordonia jinhuaensis]